MESLSLRLNFIFGCLPVPNPNINVGVTDFIGTT